MVALINGYWHKLKFHLLLKNVRIGRGFRVYGKFRIMGSGSVEMGDNCFVQSKLFKPVSFLTIFRDSRIEIGSNVGFSGTTVQCFRRVSIGDWSNIADAYIVDSAAHHLSADRRFLPVQDVPTAPVALERNVWISTRVVICQGVTIGENSVIGACSLVRSSVPPDCFYAGNPIRFIKRVPHKNEPTES
jgi:acetyltransferase-like isoleucine patch superfamily enzyme